MAEIKIPVGNSNFAEIRREGYYFVDKSGLIEELLKTEGTKALLITRPRRFGKTLAMRMLAEFFDIQKDSSELFRGLAVVNNRELCKRWLNQYPTLFLTFRGVDGLDFDGAYGQLVSVMAELYKDHLYLMESGQFNNLDKDQFYRVASKTADPAEIKTSLLKLIQFMAAYHGRQVILLIDEYDVPLAKASDKGYYREMLDVIKSVMQVLKDNDSLKFAVITGCLRIAKESIFTGTNNFVADAISDVRLNEYFGFTQREVDQFLKDTELTDKREGLKEWYDGYHFGNMDIYCPWDVVNHINNLLLNPEIKPVCYWKNSSDNGIIRSFIDIAGDTVTKKIETLLSGGCIIQKVEEDLTYDALLSSEENLWSILYLTGYLTCSGEKRDRPLPEGCLALVIPNREVREIFESTVRKWFEESTRQWDRKALFAAVWNGDGEKVTSEMTKLLRRTISYHDYKEDLPAGKATTGGSKRQNPSVCFYHAFFAGIFAGAGYTVESNKEHGEGRSDIVILDYPGDRAAVFEVKYSKAQKDLEKDCREAIKQIDDRLYGEDFREDYAQVTCYGISFYKKRCLVRVKE